MMPVAICEAGGTVWYVLVEVVLVSRAEVNCFWLELESYSSESEHSEEVKVEVKLK